MRPVPSVLDGRDLGPARSDRNVEHLSLMTDELMEELAVEPVPGPGEAVTTSGDDAATVVREREARDLPWVLHREQDSALPGVRDLRAPTREEGDAIAVRAGYNADCGTSDRSDDARELARLQTVEARLRVPHHHCPTARERGVGGSGSGIVERAARSARRDFHYAAGPSDPWTRRSRPSDENVTPPPCPPSAQRAASPVRTSRT